MCGIVGFIGSTKGFDSALLDRMTDTLAHRGPDARGTWIGKRGAFGHRRLAILDLDRRSDQPMIDDAGRVVVFNGEIYNHAELREELRGQYEFRTTSDTEVVLAAYAAWGPACFERFNGDWAIVIDDPVERRTVMSRDRLGIKPLYTWRDRKGLWFASEIKALLAGPLPPRTNVRSLLTFIQRGHLEPGNWSLVDGVEAFPPAHTAVIDKKGRESRFEYWGHDQIFSADVPDDYDEVVDAGIALVDDAVRLRMMADVPVGISLSGGMDSSLITALAARHASVPVRTFSGIAPGHDSDESVFSAAVATQWGTEHHPIELETEDFFNALETFVYHQETGASTLTTIGRERVLQVASQSVKVILDGQGGDELLAGYYGLHKCYRELASAEQLTELVMDKQDAGTPRERISAADYLRGDRGTMTLHPKLVVPPRAGRDELTNRQLQRLRGPGLMGLLHTEDRLTMRHSIEGRVPLLDHRVVEFCMSLPFHQRIAERDKRIFRDGAARFGLLPEAVYTRTDKRGFSVPYPAMLAHDPAFRQAFADRLNGYESTYGDVFDFTALRTALERHGSGSADVSNVLVRCISLMSLLDQFQLQPA